MAISGIGSQIIRHPELVSGTNKQSNLNRNLKIDKEPEEGKMPKQVRHDDLAQNNRIFQGDKRIQELKNFADQYSITDVDEEDIHYALKYGTSLFVDYSA